MYMATTKETPASQQSRQQEGADQTGTQERRLARRGMYDPFALSLFPLDFLPTPFSMNPFTMLHRLADEMDRSSGARGEKAAVPWAPTVEISTSEGNCIVRAELPGMKPEDVKVEVVDNALVIEGERKFQHEEGRSHRTERMYGRFYRVIQLP